MSMKLKLLTDVFQYIPLSTFHANTFCGGGNVFSGVSVAITEYIYQTKKRKSYQQKSPNCSFNYLHASVFYQMKAEANLLAFSLQVKSFEGN